jgi:hypothetical protein
MRLRRDDETAKRVVDAFFSCSVFLPFAGFVVVDHAGEIWGAVILNNYETALSVDLTFAGRLDARSLRELARFVFDGLKVRRVTAVTKESNKSARSALFRMGFINEGRLRNRFHDEDGLLFGLLPEQFAMRF